MWTRLRSKFLIIGLFGFFSGLPFSLSNTTLQAWLAEAGVSPAQIGLFTLIGLPHTLKFLWAPLIDRYTPPFLGRRRGWMLIGQVLLAFVVALLGMQSPTTSLPTMALLAFVIMLVATSFDISYAGYRSDLLERHEIPQGSSSNVLGYRIAMLIAGALAMILSGVIGWQYTYWLMALIILAGAVASWHAPEPPEKSLRPTTLKEAVIPPFREFFSRPQAPLVAAFIVLAGLGDMMSFTMMGVFMISGAGFSVPEYGFVAKVMGSVALISGILFSGRLLAGIGTFRTLVLITVLQQVLHLLMLALAMSQKNYALMVAAVLLANVTGAITSVVWSSYMLGLCDQRYSATQYAIVSAMAGSTRILSGPLAGWLAADFGWINFFWLNILFDLPGIYLMLRLRRTFDATDLPLSAPRTT